MITYHSVNTALPPISQPRVTAWLTRVAQTYGRRIGNINYIFTDDEEILRINRESLGHDYYTDHIGFDYSARDILSADIFISLDTVSSNATQFATDPTEELHRVIVHGLLHLCGITDKTPEERAVMEAAENAALAFSPFVAGT